jgi:galactosylceramide sulfotransferase
MPLAVLARNPQMFDLGLDMKFYQDIKAVNEYINFLDGEFDVVLILEHFDESLVLMKRLFCWEMRDILYIKQMERLKSEKNREVITNEVRSKIMSWNQADAMLYRHFNNTLWKRISLEGPGFYEDLKIFREELQHVKDECLDEGTHKTKAYGRRYVLGHRIKPNVSTTLKQYCEKMLINEVNYLDYFRKRFRKMIR